MQKMRFQYRFDHHKLREVQVTDNASVHNLVATEMGAADLTAELSELQVWKKVHPLSLSTPNDLVSP